VLKGGDAYGASHRRGKRSYILWLLFAPLEGEMRNKRIAVTGGAGFIGSNIARWLCDENDVIVIDNFLTGKRENISDISDRVRFVQEDIKNLVRV
jgi:FlaA1/EpsC-like NDP-sugar epimerase